MGESQGSAYGYWPIKSRPHRSGTGSFINIPIVIQE